jgi:phosphatidylglycerophosphatase B
VPQETGSPQHAILAATGLALVAWLGLWPSYLLPSRDVAEPLAVAAVIVAWTASRQGGPLVVVLVLLLTTIRRGLSRGEHLAELAALSAGLLVWVAGGALLNEYVLKPVLGAPRPYVHMLVEAGLLPDAAAFYEPPTRQQRRPVLEGLLAERPERLAGLHPWVRDHWVDETGYSFPSNHALASMAVATCLSAWGWSYLRGARFWASQCLFVWSVAVCYSRPLLLVHYPRDILWGGAMGIVLGLAAYASAHFVRRASERWVC